MIIGLQADYGGPADAQAGSERSRRRDDDEHMSFVEVGERERRLSDRDCTVVTYNESSREPFAVTASYLTQNHLCLKGFNMDRWLQGAEMGAIRSMVDELAEMVRKDELRLYLKRDKFSQVVDAVADAVKPVMDRTPVLLMDQ